MQDKDVVWENIASDNDILKIDPNTKAMIREYFEDFWNDYSGIDLDTFVQTLKDSGLPHPSCQTSEPISCQNKQIASFKKFGFYKKIHLVFTAPDSLLDHKTEPRKQLTQFLDILKEDLQALHQQRINADGEIVRLQIEIQSTLDSMLVLLYTIYLHKEKLNEAQFKTLKAVYIYSGFITMAISAGKYICHQTEYAAPLLAKLGILKDKSFPLKSADIKEPKRNYMQEKLYYDAFIKSL